MKTPQIDYSLKAIFGWPDVTELSPLSRAMRELDQWDGELETVPGQEALKIAEDAILKGAQIIKPLRKKTRTLHEALLVLERRKQGLGVRRILSGLKTKADKLPLRLSPDRFIKMLTDHTADVQSGRKDPSGEKWNEFIKRFLSFSGRIQDGGKWTPEDQIFFSANRDLLPNPSDENFRAQVLEMILATKEWKKRRDHPINELRNFLSKALNVEGPDDYQKRVQSVWDQKRENKKKREVEAEKKRRQRAAPQKSGGPAKGHFAQKSGQLKCKTKSRRLKS